MAAKRIAFDAEAREAIQRGVSQLARVIKVTLGPRGRNVMLERGFGSPLVTKDGVTVAKEISFEDSWEDMGAQLVKEVATKTSDGAGDGTTTAVILAEAIFEQGLRMLRAGSGPVPLRDGMRKASESVVAALKAASTEVTGSEQIAQVGGIAANNDEEIGQVLAKAMKRVGKDGVITVDEGNSLDTDVEFVDGMSFERGYLSPYFVTDAESMSCVYEDAMLLCYDGKISTAKDLIPALELAVQEQKPLVILAEEVDGEALALLVVNRMRGSLKACAVKSPGFGDNRKACLQDIATLTGGQVISKDTGLTLDSLTMSELGETGKVVVRKDTTVIIGGAGDSEAVKARLAQIKQEIAASSNSYDVEKLEDRAAKLAGGVACIKVGAATEVEMKEKKARIEDAIHATRAATEEGVVPGGGVALLRAAQSIDALGLEGDEQVGATIIKQALEAPIRQIASNAGESAAIVVKTVLESSDPAFGFNAQTLEFEDLLKAGVLDPTKVARTAFQNALSVSTLLLSTDCLVGELPKDALPGHDEDHEDY